VRALSWRCGQAFLVLFAVTALLAAGWTYRYWSRGGSYGDKLPRLVERVPAAVGDGVSRRGLEGALEAPALVLWVVGPIALPIGVGAAAITFVGLRRRRRWALVATLVLAVAAPLVALGGAGALRRIEDRHFYARSPYVRTYRALSAPLVAGSVLLVALALVDGVARARRSARPEAA
jgi:hypothetical protein